MKKLAILINSMTGGGAERVISNLFTEFVQHYEVYLVVLCPVFVYTIPKEVKIHVLAKSFWHKNNVLKIISLPLLGYQYHQFCKKNKIDISLSLLNRSNYINIFPKYLNAKHRIIISERAATTEVYPNNTLQGKISRILVRYLYPSADVIIAISQGIAHDLVKYFTVDAKKVETIYNPVDLTITALPKRNFETKPVFTFISIGRFYKQKNFELLIQAFAMLNDPSTHLVLLGDGPLRKNLEASIEKHNIQEKVSLLGFVKNIQSYLNDADCFVLSSDYEGFGNVILEALSCGKAVISTDCHHGPREILDETSCSPDKELRDIEFAKYGILVPVGDAKTLMLAMREIIKNKMQRNTYELLGPQRAAHFKKNEIAIKYMAVFENKKLVAEEV